MRERLREPGGLRQPLEHDCEIAEAERLVAEWEPNPAEREALAEN